MEECLEKGLVKAIGISNFTITKMENLLKTANTVPAVNQVECHPHFQQQKLKEYCDLKGNVLYVECMRILSIMPLGICFEAYSPLGNPGRPFKSEDDPVVMEDPVIKEIAEKHKVSTAQVCGMSACVCVQPNIVLVACMNAYSNRCVLPLDCIVGLWCLPRQPTPLGSQRTLMPLSSSWMQRT